MNTQEESTLIPDIWAALGGDPQAPGRLRLTGSAGLPSAFSTAALAAASVGAAGLAVSELAEGGPVTVDRHLAALWFDMTLRPVGWSLPAPWDPIAGDYRGKDGWIRLHTNAPHHKAAALRVLGVAPEREDVAAAVAALAIDELEEAVVGAGGVAAAMRSAADWRRHPQGAGVAALPLIAHTQTASGRKARLTGAAGRPLAGVKVLDLTRILAGPIATRFLAGFGAEVLRIDPVDWEEPSLEAEVTAGKTCARLDLRSDAGRARFLEVLGEADVLIHGYRPGALEGLGLGAGQRDAARPGLIDVSLSAYGQAGPWAGRRGFDSLVQNSCGIADAGARWAGVDKPRPLPVQALDHATGYLMAAAALMGLKAQVQSGVGTRARLSLARTAMLLLDTGPDGAPGPKACAQDGDFGPPEQTPWGPAARVRPPVRVGDARMSFDSPPTPLGAAKAAWRGQ